MFDFEKYPKLNSMDAGVIDAAIEAAAKAYSGKEQMELIHTTSVGIIEFCNFHKDGSRLDKFIDVMPTTFNHKGWMTWVREYSGWDVRENKKGVKKFLSRDDEGEVKFWLDPAAYATPFYSMPKVKQQKEDVYDFAKALDKVLGMAVKKMKDKNVEMSERDRAFITKMLNAKIDFIEEQRIKETQTPQPEPQPEDNTTNLVQLNAA